MITAVVSHYIILLGRVYAEMSNFAVIKSTSFSQKQTQPHGVLLELQKLCCTEFHPYLMLYATLSHSSTLFV